MGLYIIYIIYIYIHPSTPCWLRLLVAATPGFPAVASLFCHTVTCITGCGVPHWSDPEDDQRSNLVLSNLEVARGNQMKIDNWKHIMYVDLLAASKKLYIMISWLIDSWLYFIFLSLLGLQFYGLFHLFSQIIMTRASTWLRRMEKLFLGCDPLGIASITSHLYMFDSMSLILAKLCFQWCISNLALLILDRLRSNPGRLGHVSIDPCWGSYLSWRPQNENREAMRKEILRTLWCPRVHPFWLCHWRGGKGNPGNGSSPSHCYPWCSA